MRGVVQRSSVPCASDGPTETTPLLRQTGGDGCVDVCDADADDFFESGSAADKEDELAPLAFLKLTHFSSIALPVSYFTVGVAQTLVLTPLSFYLVRVRDIDGAQLSVLSPLLSLPWCFKIGYGMLSDCVPICGERRRPYFAIGWGLYAALCFVLAAFIERMPFQHIMLVIFLMTASYLMADVASDSLVVERSDRLKVEGSLQATCYLLRYSGAVVGSLLGTFAADPETFSFGMSISQVVFVSGLAGAAPLFLSVFLKETPSRLECRLLVESRVVPASPFDVTTQPSQPRHGKRLVDELHAMADTLSQQAAYEPMLFIVVYNACQLTNSAWANYLMVDLGFKEADLGVIAVGGSMVTWLAIALYRRYMTHASWRDVYIYTTAFTLVLSLAQLLLVGGYNKRVGISDLMFAAGDMTATSFVVGIQFLPAVNMYLAMCPEGAEGSVFALLTTMSNLAGVCASNLSTLIAMAWPLPVTNEALTAHDTRGTFTLTLAVSLLKPLPILLVGLLPSHQHEQKELRAKGRFVPLYGKVYLLCVAAAITWTAIQSIYVSVSA